LRIVARRVNRYASRIEVAAPPTRAISFPMADASPTDRIDVALSRIERAVQARDRSVQDLKQRHEALRAKVGEAISALDALGAKNG
jgi:hypothetical protein